MIWVVYQYLEHSHYEPTFFGAFYSEAGAAACLELLLKARNASPECYHIVSIPVRTLS